MIEIRRMLLLFKRFRFIGFCMVGATGAIVQYAFFYGLFWSLHWPDLIRLGVGIFAAMNSNYYLNQRWTFDIGRVNVKHLVKFYMSSVFGITAQYIVYFALTRFMVLPDFLAVGFGILVGAVVNFIGSSRFVFKMKQQ